MKRILKDPLLTVARLIVLLAQGALVLGALALTAGIAIALVQPSIIFEELNEKVPVQPGASEALFFAGSFAVILLIVVLIFIFLRHLKLIIDSVGDGDPFAPVNAVRLRSMAWLMLAVQLLALPAGGLLVALTNRLGEDPGTIDASVDLSGIMLVVTLFILARVFRHGTAMRDDLEGTV